MYYLSIAAILKDETPYLREWVAYHRAVGVEHFWLCDNGSREPVAKTLEREVKAGIVEVSDMPGRSMQLIVYQGACRITAGKTTWLACIDGDEFLVPKLARGACMEPRPNHEERPYCASCGVWMDLHDKTDGEGAPVCTVPEILKRYESSNGLVVNWQCFGPNGHAMKPAGFVIENYTKKARPEWSGNQSVKSIVRPERVLGFAIPHYATYHDKRGAVNTAGREVFGAFSRVHTDVLQLNHYLTKSAQEYTMKMTRPRADSGALRDVALAHLALHCGQVEDRAALYWLEETKRMMEAV